MPSSTKIHDLSKSISHIFPTAGQADTTEIGHPVAAMERGKEYAELEFGKVSGYIYLDEPAEKYQKGWTLIVRFNQCEGDEAIDVWRDTYSIDELIVP